MSKIANMPKPKAVSSGVEQLIDKLRAEGVQKGREEADAILEDARQKAEAILSKARKEADKYYESRRDEIESLKKSIEEEIRMMFRDNMLKSQENLVDRFTQKIQRLIAEQTMDKDLLKQIILEAVGKMRQKGKMDQAKNVEVILPEGVVGLEYLRKNPDSVKDDPLSKIVMAATADLLREGVTFSSTDDIQSGLKVYLKDEKVEIDMTSEALGEMLMEHLQPRFRAIFEGVVK